jgi:hypothetical protein
MKSGFVVRYLAAFCILIGLTACPQRTSVMTNAKPAIVLENPAGTESIVLGMGCFWGAETSFVS